MYVCAAARVSRVGKEYALVARVSRFRNMDAAATRLSRIGNELCIDERVNRFGDGHVFGGRNEMVWE